MQDNELAKGPLKNDKTPRRTLERTHEPTLLAPASISTQSTAQQAQPENVKITVEYPEELEKAWTALRDFWLDIIKEVEIEREITKKYKKAKNAR